MGVRAKEAYENDSHVIRRDAPLIVILNSDNQDYQQQGGVP
jgi:hypothetical protein